MGLLVWLFQNGLAEKKKSETFCELFPCCSVNKRLRNLIYVSNDRELNFLQIK